MKEQPGRTSTVSRLAPWCAVAVLALIGIAAAIGRVASVANGGLTEEQIRRLTPAETVQETYQLDRWFVAHPALILFHVVPGALFLTLVPFQFSSRIRNRYIRFHRWSGRVLVLIASLAGLSGLLLGASFPYGGPAAASAVFVAGSLFLFALIRAFIVIRRQDVVLHREWMIRMFSLGIGISTVRIVALILFAITRARMETLAGWSFWSGWILTFAAAEWWIRQTRPPRVAVRDAIVTATGD
jgi:uncharacterized membrane protein